MDKAKIVCEHDKLSVYELEIGEREYCYTTTEGFGRPKIESVEVETDGQNLQHIGVLRAFAGKILHGTPLIAEGVEGINGLTLSNAMHLSSWLNKPVELPFDEELFLEELNKRRRNSSEKKSIAETTFSTEGSYGSKKTH